ncbi:hypothetical protein CIG75_02390 [Tumebacillus algifaecis]|uniref:Flagellar hook-associated protein 2 n=1 Tax=Tumebacillus algifaecis TaxID=1214604 RepID=A0A223CX69_9BACL|nr:flagellar filament capping protein FliD [Tumebacillus algifaecis]ASS73940.1 hypothetical protein CIG75_02390 [Tumebacillus algifaecis]
MSISGLGGLGGLASGMDSKSLIEKLMMLEARPLLKMQQSQKSTELKKGLYQEINSSLLKLKSAVETLSDPKKLLAKKLVSSDEKVVIAKMADPNKIVSGDYNIKVEQLATAWTAKSASITPANPVTKELNWTGSFNIEYSDGTNTQVSRAINIVETDRLSDIALKINASLEDSANGKQMKVKATVVDNTLIMTSTETGENSTVKILNDTNGIFGAGKLGLTNAAGDFSSAVAGKNAEFSVNGVDVVRSKNTGLTDVIMGVELTLLKQGEPATKLEAGEDFEASEKAIQDFINAYNSTMELVNARMNESKVPDAKSDALMSKGLLRGDSALYSIQSSLRSITGTAFSSSDMFKTLNAIGIKVDTSDDGKSGRLTLDSKKFREAMNNNPNEVMKVIFNDSNGNGKLDVDDSGKDSGLAGMLFNKLFMLTDTTSTSFGPKSSPKGLLPSRMSLMDDQIKSFDSTMEAFNKRLTMRRKTLEAKFTSMELMLQKSNASAGFLAARMNLPQSS